MLGGGGGGRRTTGDSAAFLSCLCGEIVAQRSELIDALPDGLQDASTYGIAVDSIEAFLAPLLLSTESSSCLSHVARSVLLHLSMDPEFCLRPLTGVDQALADAVSSGTISGMSSLKSFFLRTVSGSDRQIGGSSSPLITPLLHSGRCIVLVESADALVLTLAKYLPAATEKPSAAATVSLQAIFHRYFSNTGLMTYLCLSTSTHDVLIDMISSARCAMFHLAPLLACTGVTKMVYGLETTRHLQQHFQLDIVNGIDVLLLAKLMDLPLLSPSSLLGFFSGAPMGSKGYNLCARNNESNGDVNDVDDNDIRIGRDKSPTLESGYILHDSLRRPSRVSTTPNSSSPILPIYLLMLCRTTHALLEIELALELGCQALEGASLYTYYKAVSKTTTSPFPENSSTFAATIPSEKIPPLQFNPMGYKALVSNQRTSIFGCRMFGPPLTSTQDKVLRALWQWRENTSVELAVSSQAVASNASLLYLSITSPTTMSDWQRYARFFPLGSCVRILAVDVLRCVSMAADFGPVPMHLSVSQSISFDDADGNDNEVEACSLSKKQSHLCASRSISPRGFSSPVPYTRIATDSGKAGAACTASTRLCPAPCVGSPGRRGAGSAGSSVSRQLPSSSKIMERDVTLAFAMSSPAPTLPPRASPELAEDVFRYAGWSTPNTLDRTNSPYPHHMVSLTGNRVVDEGDENDGFPGGLVHLPDTCEEIYEISNRNRRRNKDRQASGVREDGDDGHSIADSNTTVAGASNFKGALTSSWDSKGNSVYSSIDSIGSLASGGSACASESSAILQPIPLAPASRHFSAMSGTREQIFSQSVFDETIYFSSDPQGPMTANDAGANSATAGSTDSGCGGNGKGDVAIAGPLSGAAVEALLDFSTEFGWLTSRLREEIRSAHFEDFDVSESQNTV